ncbi:MAG: hypothetical protein EAZ21_12595 [Betaproteobacteria bacterium]|nr:MAG: hypothetical protein EAZ21_12595 [Betaproteobacteria bacterium]
MQRISHQATDRDKAPWKRVALFALIVIWLGSGIVGRDPWKPDEPIYVGILHSMLTSGGDAWWAPQVGGVLLPAETPFIHWLNALAVWLPSALLPLHEAARVSSAIWVAIAIVALALSAKRWSAGHISYLAAIVFIGCLGLYDRAHSYLPEIATLAALSLAIHGMSSLPVASNRAAFTIAVAILIAFMSTGLLGLGLIGIPVVALCFAPVLSIYRVPLARAIFFGVLACGLLSAGFALRVPETALEWWQSGAGLTLPAERERFSPHNYIVNALWFAWPAWPLAVWTLMLRFRGFAGGWQRAEVIVPLVFMVNTWVWLSIASEHRTLHTLFFLPPLALLAAFGVDTIRRTWYAMIDWFGILVLGMIAILAVVISSALYLKWPGAIAAWSQKFVPDFAGSPPWLGYTVAAIAFVVWIALVQPAHQHSRRALINWAGCVTFVWVVGQALLIEPANFRSSHRTVFERVSQLWPERGCVNSIDIPASHIAMLDYMVKRRVEPVEELADASCDYLLIARNRGEAVVDTPGYEVMFSGNRAGDRGEKIELLRRTRSGQSSGEKQS